MKKLFLVALLSAFCFGKGLVLLDPSSIEIVYLLGAEDNIKGIAKTNSSKIWPEDKTEKLASVGSYIKPNLEKIIELEPDLVVVSRHSSGVVDDLKKIGIKTKMLEANSLDDIYKNIEFLGEYTDKKDKANELIKDFKDKISKFEHSSLNGKKVVFFFAGNPPMAFTSKTLPGDIFLKMGLKNIADGLEGQTPVISNEFLLEQNPDLILITDMGMGNPDDFLKQNSVLKNTNAAKNNKIFTIKASSLMRGSPRIIDEIQKVYEDFSK